MHDPSLDARDCAPDPIDQFARWYAEMQQAGAVEPAAMTLATVDATGQPSARIVLLKGFDRRGFAFFTNYQSRKGRELEGAPRAALLFYWERQMRQVRVEGAVERLPAAESDEYFATRPRGSQLGAWASPQSATLADRAVLEGAVREAERRFASGPVPRPPHWGGFRLVPERIEFWQGRADRLHDRVLYQRAADGWQRDRLAP